MKICRKAIWPDNTYESFDLGGDDGKMFFINNPEIRAKDIPEIGKKLAALNQNTQLATNALEHTDPPPQEESLPIFEMNFQGQGEATIGNESEDEDGPLVPPVMNFSKPENGQGIDSDTEDEPLTIPEVNFGKK
jgi:hypothetical protein